MTLSGGDAVTYCDDFNQKSTVVLASGSQRDEQDENVEDQCWMSGAFLGSSTDTSFSVNIQDCESAFVVARECNKLNRRSISVLPEPTPTTQECTVAGVETCAPHAFARGVGDEVSIGDGVLVGDEETTRLLCGEACDQDSNGNDMIARGGDCILATEAIGHPHYTGL